MSDDVKIVVALVSLYAFIIAAVAFVAVFADSCG